MNRIAAVIRSKLEGSGKSAVYRALMFVDEWRRADDDVALVFDGAGTTALAEMREPASDLHHTWSQAAPALRGACRYGTRSYDVLEALEAAQMPMLATTAATPA